MFNAKKKKNIEETADWGRLEILPRILARDIKGIFHENVGTIKDRNVMNLAEAENMKCWQEYKRTTVPKKGFNHQDNHNGVFTHIE